MNTIFRIGVVLLAIGIFLYGITSVFPQVVLIYNPSVNGVYLNNYNLSPDQNNPTYFPKNVTRIIIDWRVSTGSANYVCVQNQQTIAQGTFTYVNNQWVSSFTPTNMVTGQLVSCTITTSGGFSGTWYGIPVDTAIAYRIFVNGQEVSPAATITLTSPTFNTQVHVTNYVYVRSITVTVSKLPQKNVLFNQTQNINAYGPLQSQSFAYTLPEPGRYSLNYTIVASLTATTTPVVYKLSFYFGDNEQQISLETLKQFVFPLIAVGGVMTLAGLIMGRRNE
jgi:hypothetical protein